MAIRGAGAGPTLTLPSHQPLWECLSEMASLGLLFKKFSLKSSTPVPEKPGFLPALPPPQYSSTLLIWKKTEKRYWGFVLGCVAIKME